MYIDYFKCEKFILKIVCDYNKLLSCNYVSEINVKEINENEITRLCIKQLTEFVNHKRSVFNIPLDLTDLSNFQRDVLSTLQKTNTLITYQDLAQKSGHPNASQAVGTVMSKNKYLIIIPCHLVVKKDSIGNYSGASIDVKKYLISLTTNSKYESNNVK